MASGLDTARTLVDIFAALGIPSTVVWYFRDKKKSSDTQIIRDNERDEAVLVNIKNAFELERQSLSRQIKYLESQIHERDGLIRELRGEMSDMKAQMARMQLRIEKVLPEDGE